MGSALAAQRASVEMQQAAVYKQVKAPVTATHTFFAVPWSQPQPPTPIPSAVSAAAPMSAGWRPSADCDPVSAEEADALIREQAEKQSLAPELLRAVIAKESAFYPCAVSPKGALGLMQLMPGTAEEFGVSDPFDPQQNVDAGARLLKQLIGRYGGDLSLALSAYNAGAARVDASGGIPAIKETQNYVNGIFGDIKTASVP
jgi:soluble lytic murein transglycosylase-like protein